MSDVNVSSNAPAEATPSAPAAAPAPAAPAAPVTATPNPGTQAPATGAPQSPGEGWVPSYRIREDRERMQREFNQQLTARENDWKTKYDQTQAQIRALVGVNPPQNPEVDQIKSQFFQVFPEAKELLENAAKYKEMLERSGDYDAVIDQTWRSYGRTITDRLFSKASELYGGQLNDEGKRFIHKAFVQHVQSSPENYARYQEDPSIVDDFVKEMATGLVDPIRRTASAGLGNRAGIPLPQDSPGALPRPAGAPQPRDLDERVANAWAAYQSHSRGGQ